MADSPRNREPDHWRTLANLLLLGYVRKRLSADPAAWGGWGPTKIGIPSRWPYELHDSPQARATRIAVRYKNQFADDMSALDTLPPAAEVRAYFADCMARAETDIAHQLAAT